MYLHPIRAATVVVTMIMVSTVFVETSSAQLFGRRGGLFNRGRKANCCPQVTRCCPSQGNFTSNQCCNSLGYGNAGYSNAGYSNTSYSNTGYSNAQSHPVYSNQSGQFQQGNLFNEGNANWQNPIQSSGQSGVIINANGPGQQSSWGLQQTGTNPNSAGTSQITPQFISPGSATTKTSGELGTQNKSINGDVGAGDNSRPDQGK